MRRTLAVAVLAATIVVCLCSTSFSRAAGTPMLPTLQSGPHARAARNAAWTTGARPARRTDVRYRPSFPPTHSPRTISNADSPGSGWVISPLTTKPSDS